jgi:serine/threonine-protein phosphatase 6 regulatory subunit 3
MNTYTWTKPRFRYPYVATEVLCSEIWSIVEASLKSEGKLLKTFWENILNRSPESMKAQIYIASHFAKINSVFMAKKPREVNPIPFLPSKPNHFRLRYGSSSRPSPMLWSVF